MILMLLSTKRTNKPIILALLMNADQVQKLILMLFYSAAQILKFRIVLLLLSFHYYLVYKLSKYDNSFLDIHIRKISSSNYILSSNFAEDIIIGHLLYYIL